MKFVTPTILYISTCCIALAMGYVVWQKNHNVNYNQQGYQQITADNFSLTDLQGKVVYLDFWASWCIACRDSFPWMNQMVHAYHQHDLRIITINLDQQEKDMSMFLQAYPANFPVVFNPSFSLFREYNITGLPTSILFDKQGQIVDRSEGFTLEKAKQSENNIAMLLGLAN